MMAYHIVRLYYAHYDIDIIISSGIRDGERLAKNAQQTNAFRSIIFTRNKKTFLLGHSITHKITYAILRTYEIINNFLLAKK